jgi:hypothetical protein
MRIEQAKLVGVVEIPLAEGRRAVALMFDNMRWTLDFSGDRLAYQKRRAEIGTVMSLVEDDETDGSGMEIALPPRDQ